MSQQQTNLVISTETIQKPNDTITIKLKAKRKKVIWDEQTAIDNEQMNKKSSKSK